MPPNQAVGVHARAVRCAVDFHEAIRSPASYLRCSRSCEATAHPSVCSTRCGRTFLRPTRITRSTPSVPGPALERRPRAAAAPGRVQKSSVRSQTRHHRPSESRRDGCVQNLRRDQRQRMRCVHLPRSAGCTDPRCRRPTPRCDRLAVELCERTAQAWSFLVGTAIPSAIEQFRLHA